MTKHAANARPLAWILVAASVVLAIVYVTMYAVFRDPLFLALMPTAIGLLVPGFALLAKNPPAQKPE